MKEISGDTRVFGVINTTEYNNDGRWAVTTAILDELEGLGFVCAEIKRIESLSVGGEMRDFDYEGVIVIRIA